MLEINNNHKKLDFKNNKPLKKIIALGVGIGIAVYSGSLLENSVYSYEEHSNNHIENKYSLVPESCYEDILSFCDGNEITRHDLNSFDEMIFSID